MKEIFTKYKLKLVKDEQFEYESGNVNHQRQMYTHFKNIFHLEEEPEEVLVMLCFDNMNRIIGAFELSRGTTFTVITSIKEIFKRAILCNSSSIALCHNHPMGDNEPSDEDIAITKDIIKIGKIIQIPLLDHAILGEDGGYKSIISHIYAERLKENGKINTLEKNKTIKIVSN